VIILSLPENKNPAARVCAKIMKPARTNNGYIAQGNARCITPIIAKTWIDALIKADEGFIFYSLISL
jgi:hypothetical protein